MWYPKFQGWSGHSTVVNPAANHLGWGSPRHHGTATGEVPRITTGDRSTWYCCFLMFSWKLIWPRKFTLKKLMELCLERLRQKEYPLDLFRVKSLPSPLLSLQIQLDPLGELDKFILCSFGTCWRPILRFLILEMLVMRYIFIYNQW